jgi:methyltransferase FkbM-like protein
VLPMLAESDFAKIDIEGAEWPILRDPRFAEVRPPVLVLEYHANGCGDADPEHAARSLLRAADYELSPIPGAPAGAGMLWAWLPPLSASG